eukprot:gene34086-38528_t
MKPDLRSETNKHGIFLDRELSQLAFNRRVMAQAADPTVPLLERLRYLCIVSSNLDEFFEVRVASLLAAAATDDRSSALHPALAEHHRRVCDYCHARNENQ